MPRVVGVLSQELNDSGAVRLACAQATVACAAVRVASRRAMTLVGKVATKRGVMGSVCQAVRA
jgi:hypothetical protein